MKENQRIERMHYVLGALIIVLALTAQPFASLGIQAVLAPKLVTLLEKMKTDPMQAFYDELNLDQETFDQCKSDANISKIITDDQKLGESLGVNGTPTTFIGKRNAFGDIVLYKDSISGALPEDSVMSAINANNKVVSTNIIKNQNLHLYGSPNADTILVEFSDLQCPFCAKFHPTIKGIVDNSNGKIAMVYMHFPLPFHDKAMPLAISAECVAAQKGESAFFGFTDANFDSQGN